MPEIKDKKYGNTLFYIDGNEVREKSKYGHVKFYFDDFENNRDSRYGKTNNNF
ncbi:hypothetical protein [Flavobacterium sp. ZB4R12]|uniref:hypothetical protein n=1 Tax=Flavobacterium sp. ZB4R12 TaxID=3398732 RepID=UPI003AABA86C